MPAAAGLLGAPARADAAGDGCAFRRAGRRGSVALGILALAAHLLRRRLMEEEALPFPTGTPPRSPSPRCMPPEPQENQGRGVWLAVAGVVATGSRCYGTSSSAQMVAVPGSVGGVPAASLAGVAWSPMLVAVGMMWRGCTWAEHAVGGAGGMGAWTVSWS